MEFNGRPPPSEKTDLAEGVEVRRPNQDGFLLSNIAALPFVLSLFPQVDWDSEGGHRVSCDG